MRCSCRAAICGSCGVRINGQPGLACHTHLDSALAGAKDGVITVEPMGNMPVISDLIVDMDAVHWKKIQRVTPWLINKEPIPEREYIVPRESMIDVTQTAACIQCGACVSDCLSMEVDPLFVGPAALAKAYRFVGDPRDAKHEQRLKDLTHDRARHLRLHALLQVHRGVPEGRRADEPDHAPAPDRRRATTASTTATTGTVTRRRSSRSSATTACCGRPSCCRAPTAATRGSASSRRRRASSSSRRCPAITTALLRRKVTITGALKPHKIPSADLTAVKKIYDIVESRDQRDELNLYITGTDADNAEHPRAPRREGTPAT